MLRTILSVTVKLGVVVVRIKTNNNYRGPRIAILTECQEIGTWSLWHDLHAQGTWSLWRDLHAQGT